MQFRNETVICEYQKSLNPCVVLLFISTHVFFQKVQRKTISSFSLTSCSNINIVFHLWGNKLYHDASSPAPSAKTTVSMILWQHFHCYFHTNQRDFLRNECNHAGTAAFYLFRLYFDCTHRSTKLWPQCRGARRTATLWKRSTPTPSS